MPVQGAPMPTAPEGPEDQGGSASDLVQEISEKLGMLSDMLQQSGGSDQEAQALQGIQSAFQDVVSQLAGAPAGPQAPQNVSMEGGIGGKPMPQQG